MRYDDLKEIISNKIIYFCKCQLENGQIVDYDLCLNERNDSKYPNFKYLGCGVIYSVNNVIQNFTNKQYFYKRNDKLHL